MWNDDDIDDLVNFFFSNRGIGEIAGGRDFDF